MSPEVSIPNPGPGAGGRPARLRRAFPAALALALALAGALGCGGPVVDPAGKTPELTAVWKKFRQRFPFHAQTIALGRIAGGGDRVLVLSEPPPHVTLAGLAKLGTGASDLIETRRHALGHDGWVKDVVIRTDADDVTLRQLVASLSRWLYGTDYKTYVYDLDRPARDRVPARLDLRVSAPEIAAWLLQSGDGLLPVGGGAEQPLSQVFANSRSAVYLSAAPGLVAWWLPAAQQVDGARSQVRQFALDSDLVIGAIRDGAGVLILGRERQVPVDLLPPLRAETIAQLDGADPRQLGQSYERRHVLAGRRDERSDWAPIYLSPELIDTEYGSLLNITDQMLKSWSSCGLTRYVDFPYPNPASWPFPQPLMLLLDADSLTYNWNTRGAAYQTAFGDHQVLALNRTGALPVSYIPGEAVDGEPEVQAAEEHAYGYFSGLSDPNLVRVVQYAALYQILKASRPAPAAGAAEKANPPAAALERLTVEILGRARALTDPRMRQVVELAIRQARAEGASERQAADLAHDLVELRSDLAKEHPGDFAAFAARLAKPGSEEDLEAINKYQPLASAVAALERTDETYPRKFPGKGWIHTSVVVVSTNSGLLANAVGGHNLYSDVTRFRADPEVVQGAARVIEEDGNRVVLVNPADSAKLPEIVKTAGRQWESAGEAASEIGRALAEARPAAIRSPAEALDLGARPPAGLPPGRGFDLAADGPFRRMGRWGHEPVALPHDHPLLASLHEMRQRSTNSYALAKSANGTITMAYGDSGASVNVFSGPDASNLILEMSRGASPDQPLLLDLHGWTPEEADGWLRTLEIRQRAPLVDRDTVGIVRERGALAESGRQDPRLDFSRAKMSHEIVEREGGKEVSYKFEVPRATEVRPSLLIRIRTFFAGLVDTPRIEAFGQALRGRLVALLSGRPRGGFDLGLELRREIRNAAREQGVDVHAIHQTLRQNAVDVYIVRLVRPEGGPWSVATASRQIVAHLPSPSR